MPNRARVALVVLLLLSLAGCMSNKPKEPTICALGNWQGMGYKDGLEGKDYAYVSHHHAACLVEGFELDLMQYRRGYLEGLQHYCTPANGRKVGLVGESYRGVCPERLATGFIGEYEAGRSYYLQQVKVDKIEDKLNQTRQTIRQLKSDLFLQKQRLKTESLSADLQAYTQLEINKIQRQIIAKTAAEKALLIDYVLEKSKLNELDRT